MSDTTGIGWTDATWNPWHGCTKVSPGCAHCYMFREKIRYGQNPELVVRSNTKFRDPLKWKEPRMVFTCSWSDWFHEAADAWRDEAWEIIRATPHLTYQILTKRPERIVEHLPKDWGAGYANGRASLVCRLCERKRRGICRDCGLAVAGQVGKALRCAFHTKEAKGAQWRKYKGNHAALLRKRGRDYYRLDPARRAKKNARKMLWRKAHPEKVKQYKRTEALSQNPKTRAYHAKRRERERLELRARERARGRGIVELRTCLTPGCDIVVTGRKKKCTRCKEGQVRAALDAIASLRGAA